MFSSEAFNILAWQNALQVVLLSLVLQWSVPWLVRACKLRIFRDGCEGDALDDEPRDTLDQKLNSFGISAVRKGTLPEYGDLGPDRGGPIACPRCGYGILNCISEPSPLGKGDATSAGDD